MRAERLYYFLGICGLTATFVFAVIGAYGTMIGVPDAGLAGAACAIVFLIPSIVFLFYSRQRIAADGRLRELADVLKGYRHIKMDELAVKIRTSPEEAELLVAACVGRGYVTGHIDHATGTFTVDAENQSTDGREASG